MASLQAGVNPLVIWMVGGWKSWAMMHCLHRTATSDSDFAAQMLISSNFTITTHLTLPANTATVVTPLLTEESDYQLRVNVH